MCERMCMCVCVCRVTGEEAVFDLPTVPCGRAPDSYLSSLSFVPREKEVSVCVCAKLSMNASVFLTACVCLRGVGIRCLTHTQKQPGASMKALS